jgi:hypothetical protein
MLMASSLLRCLACSGPDADLLEVFKTEVTAEERRALRSYLADPQVLEESRKVPVIN